MWSNKKSCYLSIYHSSTFSIDYSWKVKVFGDLSQLIQPQGSIRSFTYVMLWLVLFYSAINFPDVVDKRPGQEVQKREIVNGNEVVLIFCETCHHFRPPRSHHCEFCDVCIGNYCYSQYLSSKSGGQVHLFLKFASCDGFAADTLFGCCSSKLCTYIIFPGFDDSSKRKKKLCIIVMLITRSRGVEVTNLYHPVHVN